MMVWAFPGPGILTVPQYSFSLSLSDTNDPHSNMVDHKASTLKIIFPRLPCSIVLPCN